MLRGRRPDRIQYSLQMIGEAENNTTVLSITPPICGTDSDNSSVNNDNHCAGEWVGNRRLKIRLGLGAVAVPVSSMTTGCGNRSSITLLDGGVRTEAFALLSSSGCTAISPPDNPAPTSAVLVAPQVSFTSSSLKLHYVACTAHTFNLHNVEFVQMFHRIIY